MMLTSRVLGSSFASEDVDDKDAVTGADADDGSIFEANKVRAPRVGDDTALYVKYFQSRADAY